jgi:DNA-binding SARP family transcriptional activator
VIRLRLLGNPSIVGNDGSLITGPATQRHRIALLAVLTISAERGQSRDKLMSLLWSDRDAEHSRQLLNQAVYNLRKALGDDALVSDSDSLRLNSELIETDVAKFEAALARGDNAEAVGLYHGPLIDGLFLSDAPEFERWTDRERARLAGGYAKALESLAEFSEGARDFERAVGWWKSRAAHDPYDSRVALRLMQALDASGNRAGALQQAAIHQRMLQQEFGTQPAAGVTEYAERLRREPTAVTSPGAVDHPSSVDNADTGAASTAVVTELGRGPSARLLRYGVAALVLFVSVVAILWARPERTASASPRPSDRSIAVLPLANQSVDPRDAALADGMTDELIAILAKDTALRVIGSTSVSSYRNRR